MPIQVGPQPSRTVTKIVTASYTRPADTTAYAAGDVLAESTSAATILTFPEVSRFNGYGFSLTAVTAIVSSAQATKPDLELWLFDSTITMQNDNVAWNPTDADMEKCIGIVKFPLAGFLVGAILGANNNIAQSVAYIPGKCAPLASSKSIYGVVVVRNAYTPVSGEKFTFRLHVAQD